MKNKKRFLVIFSVILALMSVITPLCVSAAETEVTATAETITDLTNTTWYVLSATTSSVFSDEFQGTVKYNTTSYSFSSMKVYTDGAIWFDNYGADDGLRIPVGNYFTLSISSNPDDERILTYLETNGTQLKVTDLNDTTWNVPAGWEADAGYGSFSVNYTFEDDYYTDPSDYTTLSIGYTYNRDEELVSTSNSIAMTYAVYTDPSQSSKFTFSSGSDSTNPKLIAWLSEYGELQGEDEDPETSVFTLYYGIDDPRNVELAYEVGMTWENWVDSVYNTIGASILSVRNIENDVFDVVCVGSFDTDNEYSVGYFAVSLGKAGDYVTVSSLIEYELYDVNGVVSYNDSYSAGYASGYDFGSKWGYDLGYKHGESAGYDQGYNIGLNEGYSSSLGTNLIGSTFEGISGALKSFVLFSTTSGIDVSIWTIISGFIGISLFIWILKLFAGG